MRHPSFVVLLACYPTRSLCWYTFLPQVAAAGARQETDDDLAESQPLLSPPAGIASHPSYLCDWTKAIPCTMTGLAPLPCQNKGCEVLIHHIYQAAWESREGHDDVVARYAVGIVRITTIGPHRRRMALRTRRKSLQGPGL